MQNSRSTEKTLQSILGQLDELLPVAREPEVSQLRAKSVSGWSIAEQLEHLLIADRNTLKALEGMVNGTLDSQGGQPSLPGRLILGLQFIPRGTGRAPESSRPKGLQAFEIDSGLEDVRQRFRDWGSRLGELEKCPATCRHGILGHFTAFQWLKFVKIHQHHHWKIVRDIRKAA